MVRPVEPDPPQHVPRTPEKVRGTHATPEQLGQPPVREQGERVGQRRGKPGEGSPREDSVSLEQAALAGDTTATLPKGDRRSQGSDKTGSNLHLDVKG